MLHSQQYSPIAPGGRDLQLFDPLLGDTLRRPMLVAAWPFELIPFAAPRLLTHQALRLDIRASTLADERVTVAAMPGLPLAEHSSLALFDTAPLERGLAPRAAGSLEVCGNAADWSLTPAEGSDQMLLVVGPGDLEPLHFDSFKLELDFPLRSVAGQATDQVAILRDLGPLDGCKSASGPGYPRRLAVTLAQELEGKRLLVTPQSPLAGGHRFELELVPAGLVASGATADPAAQLSYWSSAPTRFAFATRKVEGDPVGSLDPSQFPFGGIGTARDLLRFGKPLAGGFGQWPHRRGRHQHAGG